MKAKAHKIISFVLTAFLLAVAILVFLPRIFGLSGYYVESDSMSPTIKKGDLVIVRKVSFEEIRVNDIITFTNNVKTKHCTHRVISVFEDDKSFKTKGDNNDFFDPQRTSFEFVQGKVIYKLPFVGYFSLILDKTVTKVIIVFLLILYTAIEIENYKKRREGFKYEK